MCQGDRGKRPAALGCSKCVPMGGPSSAAAPAADPAATPGGATTSNSLLDLLDKLDRGFEAAAAADAAATAAAAAAAAATSPDGIRARLRALLLPAEEAQQEGVATASAPTAAELAADARWTAHLAHLMVLVAGNALVRAKEGRDSIPNGELVLSLAEAASAAANEDGRAAIAAAAAAAASASSAASSSAASSSSSSSPSSSSSSSSSFCSSTILIARSLAFAHLSPPNDLFIKMVEAAGHALLLALVDEASAEDDAESVRKEVVSRAVVAYAQLLGFMWAQGHSDSILEKVEAMNEAKVEEGPKAWPRPSAAFRVPSGGDPHPWRGGDNEWLVYFFAVLLGEDVATLKSFNGLELRFDETDGLKANLLAATIPADELLLTVRGWARNWMNIEEGKNEDGVDHGHSSSSFAFDPLGREDLEFEHVLDKTCLAVGKKSNGGKAHIPCKGDTIESAPKVKIDDKNVPFFHAVLFAAAYLRAAGYYLPGTPVALATLQVTAQKKGLIPWALCHNCSNGEFCTNPLHLKLASIVDNVEDKNQHFNMRLKARDKATMLVAMNDLRDDRKGSLFINIYKHRPMPKGVGAASRVKKPRGGRAANRSRQETTQASGDDESDWADDESEEGESEESEESEEEDSEEENAAPAAATAAAAAPSKATRKARARTADAAAARGGRKGGGGRRGGSGGKGSGTKRGRDDAAAAGGGGARGKGRGKGAAATAAAAAPASKKKRTAAPAAAAAAAAAAAPPKAAKNPAPTAAPSAAVAVPARAGGASGGASGAGGFGVGPSRQPLSPVVEPVSRGEGKTSRVSEKVRSPSYPDDDDDFM